MAQTIADFIEGVRQNLLLTPAQFEELNRCIKPRHAEPRALAGDLVARGWLTRYQATKPSASCTGKPPR